LWRRTFPVAPSRVEERRAVVGEGLLGAPPTPGGELARCWFISFQRRRAPRGRGLLHQRLCGVCAVAGGAGIAGDGKRATYRWLKPWRGYHLFDTTLYGMVTASERRSTFRADRRWRHGMAAAAGCPPYRHHGLLWRATAGAERWLGARRRDAHNYGEHVEQKEAMLAGVVAERTGRRLFAWPAGSFFAFCLSGDVAGGFSADIWWR